MPSPLPAFQASVYTRLSTNITSATTYDYLPVVDPSTGVAPVRPWIAMIGESDEQVQANKAGNRHRLTATLRAESETPGGLEVRNLCNSIITAFDTALVVSGFTVDRTPEAVVNRFADISERGDVLFVGIVELRFNLQT